MAQLLVVEADRTTPASAGRTSRNTGTLRPRADHQVPPDEAWSTWLFLGGRGAGKTFAGAAWMIEQARALGRLALIGPTFHDVREVMIEGPSGLRALSPRDARPRWEVSRRRLVWPSGVTAHAFSSEDPEALRGPQFAAAWGDEMGKWRHPDETFDMLQFGLRLGDRPRQMMTTTPRAIPLPRQALACPIFRQPQARVQKTPTLRTALE